MKVEKSTFYNIQLSDLQLFLYVAKYKNFTKAGELMYMTQPGVSKRIHHLEKELGLILFHRTKRDVFLTPAGQTLEKCLQNILPELFDGITNAHIVQSGTSGILRIAYLQWGNPGFIPTIKKFTEIYPQFEIEISGKKFKELNDALLTDQADVIISTSYDCNRYKEDFYNLFYANTVPLTVCINKNNRLAQKKSVSILELKDQPVLFLNNTESPGYNTYVKKLFENYGIRPIIGSYADTGLEHIANISLDKGILFVSQYFMNQIFNNNFVQIPVKDEYLHIVIVSKKENKSLVLGEFLKYILSTEAKW